MPSPAGFALMLTDVAVSLASPGVYGPQKARFIGCKPGEPDLEQLRAIWCFNPELKKRMGVITVGVSNEPGELRWHDRATRIAILAEETRYHVITSKISRVNTICSAWIHESGCRRHGIQSDRRARNAQRTTSNALF